MFLLEFDSYSLAASALIVLAVQVVFFAAAFAFKTDKVTDLSYGLTFVFMSFLYLASFQEMSQQIALCYWFIIIWGLRLAFYLFIRILKMGSDRRFDDRRDRFVSLVSFWSLQALAVWVIMLPFTVVSAKRLSEPQALAQTQEWSALEILGVLMWCLGFLIEAAADQQKFSFKSKPGNQNKWMSTGLWRYSRHPNYFGETLLWWGLFVMVIPLLSNGYWLLIISPVFITILLLKVSGIPLLQASAEKKYGKDPKYKEYKKNTNLFFPWLPKE